MKNTLVRYYIAVNQLTLFLCGKVWVRLTRSPKYTRYSPSGPITKPVIFAANHQTLIDSFVIFSGLSVREFLRIAPIKFMTWHEYYNTKYKPILFSWGCYPSHGPGRSGLQGAYWAIDNGYSSFIYPEGTRTDPAKRGKAFMGIVNMIKYTPGATRVLLYIDWHKRASLLSRPKLIISYGECPLDTDITNPDAIMNTIYETQ